MRCPSCESELLASHQRFCQDCGQRVRDRDTTGSIKRPSWAETTQPQHKEMRKQIEAAEAQLSGSRRVVTVLFADIQGFTSLCEKLDAEKVTDLINLYFGRFSEIVYQQKGYVDKYMGDALMALFGAPIAYGQDPQNAARAALEIIETLKELNRKTGHDLKIRIGLNLGPVVMGGVGAGQKVQFSVLGDAVNIAQRIQSLANPNEIMIGPEFAAAVHHEFICEKGRSEKLKGRDEAVQVYRLAGAAQNFQRTQLIGRSKELAEVSKKIEVIETGRGYNLRLAGEQGIGKTSFKNELKSHFLADGGVWLEARMDSSGRPLHSIKDILTRILGSRLSVDPQTRELRILHLKPWNLPASIRVNLENLLMRADCPEDVSAQKHNWFSSMVELLAALQKGQRLALFFDHFDKMDSLSQDFVNFLARENTFLFLGIVSESENSIFDPLELGPLTTQEIVELACLQLKVQSIPGEIQDLLLKRTRGNPYFVKEFVSYLKQHEMIKVEAGVLKVLKLINAEPLPETLQSLLLSKLDKLYPADREVLEFSALAGDKFSDRLLQRALKGKDNLRESIQFLIQSDYLQVEKGAGADSVQYFFSDKLIQEVLRKSLLDKRKRAIHLFMANAAEFLKQQDLWNESRLAEEVIARHFVDAGDFGVKALEAARAWRKRAENDGAWESAAEAIKRILQILKVNENSKELLRESIALGDAWIQQGNIKGAKDAFGKIAAQSRKEEDVESELLALSRLLDLARNENNRDAGSLIMSEIEKSLMILTSDNASFRIFRSMGNWYRFMGSLKDALQAFNRALKLCDPADSRQLAELLNDLGIVFALLHDSEASNRCFDEGIRVAERPWLRMKLKMNRANQKMLAGQLESALEDFVNLQKESETMGDWACLARSLYHQVLCQIRLQQCDGLKNLLSRAHDLFRRLQFLNEMQVCEILLREVEVNANLSPSRLSELLRSGVRSTTSIR